MTNERRTAGPAPDTRDRILAAAEALAQETGPASLSLEAVAARAGVSKGGLLYHFPSKAKLMEGLVEHYLARFEAALRPDEASRRPDGVIAAYVEAYMSERIAKAPPSCGLVAALIENPSILDPIRERERAFLDAIRANARDPDFATAAFLAMHGIRSLEILGLAILTEEEAAGAAQALQARLAGEG